MPEQAKDLIAAKGGKSKAKAEGEGGCRQRKAGPSAEQIAAPRLTSARRSRYTTRPQAEDQIVKAWKADETGNLVFRKTARNVHPPAAMGGKVGVAEVEEIVPTDHIRLPGIYVHRPIRGPHEKRIEQLTVRAA